MNRLLQAIGAIVRKDLHGLQPLIILAAAVFLVQPLIASLDILTLGGDTEFWAVVQANIYWLGYLLGVLLMMSVLQQDPARSLNHDWLTRPINRSHWLAAKLAFLFLTVVVPVVLGRFLINLGEGYGVVGSIAYAVAVERLPAMLAIPLLFAIALLAPTLRKTISLMVMVLLVFLLPAWSVTRPLLNALGIDLASDLDGLMWLQGLPIVVAGVSAALLVYILLYSRRRLGQAYLAFAACILVMFLSAYPPSWMYNWDRAIALHRTIINTPETSFGDSVVLEPLQACFPAVSADGGSNDQAGALLAQASWPASYLAVAGPDAITMATPIRSRKILVDWFTPSARQQPVSVDWRIERLRARAWYSADSLDGSVELVRSPSHDPVASVETDYWMIPGEAGRLLANDPTTRLTLIYDLALLAPEPYELATDGKRRVLPGLGSCKAELDQNANTIEVDCLGRGARPALISAELIGVESSRVDSAVRASYTPGWADAIGRHQYTLTLAPASLVDARSILLTAYNAKHVLQKSLVFEGMLGNSSQICPLPHQLSDGRMLASEWSDTSAHEVRSIAVEPDVRVEVLDWRAGANKEAPTLMLLPGLGATAHSYDKIAVALAGHYNVVGMTRRGTGDSGKPDHGYDTERLSQDVLQVMDTLSIDTAFLVGHSIAGEELSYLGAHSPERFQGLVYLDAAYDRVGGAPDNKRYRALNILLPPEPPIRPAESTSYQALQRYSERIGRGGRLPPEGEILASYDLGTGSNRHDALYLDAIMASIKAPDYGQISVPALAIYAIPGSPTALMEAWYDKDDPVLRELVSELYLLDKAHALSQMTRFDDEVADSQVLAIENADHWIFVSHEQEILKAMQEFISEQERQP
jgi:pimeloyl-ACP methyl ester carboxylesterase